MEPNSMDMYLSGIWLIVVAFLIWSFLKNK